jgi:hypothetical protein
MRKFSFFLLLLLVVFGCMHTTKEVSKHKDHGTPDSTASNSEKKPNWADKLVQDYINHSNNELIKSEPKKDVKWTLDNIRNTDTAKYLVFHIGHESFDVNNGDTCCYRFTTDEWIYIDSLRKSVYEYDLAKDKLNKWGK